MAATMTAPKNNLVAHFYDDQANNDKIYIACVRKNAGQYEVVGKWGRRGGHISEQVKTNCADIGAAMHAAQHLFHTKTKKGYKNITDSDYHGPVTFDSVSRWLEPDLEIGNAGRSTPAPLKKTKSDREFEVTCVDNTGITKNFDKGEQYMAKQDPDDDSMFLVFDPYGKWQRCLASRFEEK